MTRKAEAGMLDAMGKKGTESCLESPGQAWACGLQTSSLQMGEKMNFHCAKPPRKLTQSLRPPHPPGPFLLLHLCWCQSGEATRDGPLLFSPLLASRPFAGAAVLCQSGGWASGSPEPPPTGCSQPARPASGCFAHFPNPVLRVERCSWAWLSAADGAVLGGWVTAGVTADGSRAESDLGGLAVSPASLLRPHGLLGRELPLSLICC